MASIFGVDHKTIAITSLAITTGVAAYSTYKYLALKNLLYGDDCECGHSHDGGHGHSHGGGGEEGDFGGYEDSKNSFMSLHYATVNETARYSFIPKDAVEFPRRAADICTKYFADIEKVSGMFCLAIGILVNILFNTCRPKHTN